MQSLSRRKFFSRRLNDNLSSEMIKCRHAKAEVESRRSAKTEKRQKWRGLRKTGYDLYDTKHKHVSHYKRVDNQVCC